MNFFGQYDSHKAVYKNKKKNAHSYKQQTSQSFSYMFCTKVYIIEITLGIKYLKLHIFGFFKWNRRIYIYTYIYIYICFLAAHILLLIIQKTKGMDFLTVTISIYFESYSLLYNL